MSSFTCLKVNGFSDCHVQGIAVDKNREYLYLSFTTSLIKTDFQGNIVGSVKGIIGHLGCLAYNPDDGRVYASLEHKDDIIGKGILEKLDKKIELPNSFYVVSFDADKIVRPDMDAEKDGIMKAVYLKDVCEDYMADGHKYGCSGIDGITFAPKPGETSGNYLYVAYGIYGDIKRKDNDYQILLRYDTENFAKYELPLEKNKLHTSGPDRADDKYFIYTGNTNFGIQNLEYDADNRCLFAAVYKGRKIRFPNYSMFAVDMGKCEKIKKLRGLDESAKTLDLKKFPFFSSRGSISGCRFLYGSTGMISLGKNRFLFSEDFKDYNGYGTEVCSYILDCEKGFIKKEIDIA